MKTGDRVIIGYDGRSVPGTILLASPCGRSLVVSFDAMLGGHIGAMPVLQQDDGSFVALITGESVTLQPEEVCQ